MLKNDRITFPNVESGTLNVIGRFLLSQLRIKSWNYLGRRQTSSESLLFQSQRWSDDFSSWPTIMNQSSECATFVSESSGGQLAGDVRLLVGDLHRGVRDGGAVLVGDPSPDRAEIRPLRERRRRDAEEIGEEKKAGNGSTHFLHTGTPWAKGFASGRRLERQSTHLRLVLEGWG